MYVPTQILIATGEWFFRRASQGLLGAATEIAGQRGLRFKCTDTDGIAWSVDGENWFQHIGDTPGGRYRRIKQED